VSGAFNERRQFRLSSQAAGPVADLAVRGSVVSVCVCVPTYNEAENVESLVGALLEVFEREAIAGNVLVIDDGSPDGTGAIADEISRRDGRVHVLHRERKEGIGKAYQAGFAWALERGFEFVVEMDCDFSHDPSALPQLLEAAEGADLVLGSRYVGGGEVRDWSLARRLISRGGSGYARTILGLRIRDLTGGFKCFRAEALAQLGFETAEARGYGFQIEMTYRAVRAGLRVVEVPIVFRNRAAGSSKMSAGIALEAARLVLRLRRSGLTEPVAASSEPSGVIEVQAR
jgi:dolichol-phosphate mannosyltransferase